MGFLGFHHFTRSLGQILAALFQPLGRFRSFVECGLGFFQLCPVALEAVDGNSNQCVGIAQSLVSLGRFRYHIIYSLAQRVEQRNHHDDNVGLHRGVKSFPCRLQSVDAEDAHLGGSRHSLDGTRGSTYCLACLFACLLCALQCFTYVTHHVGGFLYTTCRLTDFVCGIGGFLQGFLCGSGTILQVVPRIAKFAEHTSQASLNQAY